MAVSTSLYAPDALHTLRDSFALHLASTRAPKTTRIYLAALDALIRHLEAQAMPAGARAVRREHVESYVARRRDEVKPTTLSLEFRALQQFWRWALEEEEIDRSPMERMKPPRIPEAPVAVISTDEFRRLLKTTEPRTLNDRRDAALLLLIHDTGVRRGEVIGLRLADVGLRERLAFVTGKGGHVRAVRFGTKAAVALDRYLRLRRGHRYAGNDAFWAAGLPRLHPHQLRHTFAHEYLAAGGQEGDLQRLPDGARRSCCDATARASPTSGLARHIAAPRTDCDQVAGPPSKATSNPRSVARHTIDG